MENGESWVTELNKMFTATCHNRHLVYRFLKVIELLSYDRVVFNNYFYVREKFRGNYREKVNEEREGDKKDSSGLKVNEKVLGSQRTSYSDTLDESDLLLNKI